MDFQASRYDLLQVAQGRKPADIFLFGGQVVNVYSGEILNHNVAICEDRIAYVGQSEDFVGEHTRIIDCTDKYITPGYIETHSHPWVVYNPVSLTEKVLALGTTTMVHDNLFFYLYMGAKGFAQMVRDLRVLPGNHRWLVRVLPQSQYVGERDWFNPQDLQSLLELDEIIGTAEVTRWPTLYQGDPQVIETVEYAKQLGKVSDGHTSGCSYERLNSIVAAGISACHEAISVNEVLDRLRLGLWTTLRNSSLRPDFPEIVKSITESKISTSRLLMTTDGPHPGFIEKNGFVDGLIRDAVELGVPPIQAIQMATINAATYLGMDQYIGGIAPGRRADMNILTNLKTFRPEFVISGGRVIAENGKLTVQMPSVEWSKYIVKKAFSYPKDKYTNPHLYLYPHSDTDGTVPVIDFPMAAITKRQDVDLPCANGHVDISSQPDLVYAALVDRGGKWVSHAILKNFAAEIEGMASTYNTTTHLLVVGRNPSAMAKAVEEVYQMGGGIAIVEGEKTILNIPLPFTGMMTTDPSFAAAVKYHDELFATVKERGYKFHDILYSLLFLTCDCLPGLRLISEGVYDVKSNTVIVPSKKMQPLIFSSFIE